jgi:hypothetical protein
MVQFKNWGLHDSWMNEDEAQLLNFFYFDQQHLMCVKIFQPKFKTCYTEIEI